MNRIKQLIKSEIANVEKQIQSVANDLGYTDLDTLTQEECELIAEEINKNNGDLVIRESNPAPITKAQSNGKKPKTTQSQPNANPVNPNMKEVITGLVKGTEKLYETTDRFCEQLTADTSQRITKRLTQVNPDILASVTNELKTEAEKTENFCNELEQMFRESYSSF
ncbi:MAG: hypothetical protein ACKO86_16050 [Dolichospermum sp.]